MIINVGWWVGFFNYSLRTDQSSDTKIERLLIAQSFKSVRKNFDLCQSSADFKIFSFQRLLTVTTKKGLRSYFLHYLFTPLNTTTEERNYEMLLYG